MNIFISLGLLIASYLLSAFSKPKTQAESAKPALDADITFPQPDDGTKQAVIFGEAWMPNWAVLWHGNYRANPVQDHGTTIGYMYSYSMLMGLCRGPINEVLEIDIGGRTALRPSDDGTPPLNGTTQFLIEKPKLFGGTPQGNGGIVVRGWLLMGDQNQVLPANVYKMYPGANGQDLVPLASMMPGEHPGYRGMATMFIDGYISYNSTNPQSWSFCVRRHTAGWDDGATWYPEKAVITVNSGNVVIPNPQLSDPNISDDDKRTLARTVTVSRDIQGMNPVHVLVEGMTNRTWGRGLVLSQIDVASYKDAADIIYDEGLACATKWDREGSLEDFMQTIIDYMGATQYPDPVTGLIKLHLIRGDYDVNAIPTFDYNSGLKRIVDNTSSTADTSASQIVVTYTSPVTGKKGSVRAQNLALYTAQNAVIIQTKTYDCCPNADLASRLAKRDLKAYSSGLRRIKLEMDASAWSITPGSVLKIANVTDNKIINMVLRVGKISTNGGTDGTITLECVQDVFALDSTAYNYTIETQPVWKPPVPGDTAIVPAPPLVSNLHLVKPWDGQTFSVAWDRGSDANYYDVQVVVPATGKVVRFSAHLLDAAYTYTIDQMLADGGPWRSIEIQVRAVSFTNGTGPWFKIGLYNPQVAALTGIQITEAMKQAFLQYNRPVENDWVGTLVYISDTSGFVPDGSNQVYDGVDLFVIMTQLADGTLLKGGQDYYLRCAGYDNFGKDSLNFSSEVVFSVVAAAPDANTIVSEMIKDGALDVAKFARSIAPPLIVPDVPPAYAGSDLIYVQRDNKLYRWDPVAKEYTSATDAADIAGTIDVDSLPQIPTDILIGLIPTTQLDGKITAGQIAANAIGADQIAAGAIIAGKLAAGSIQAGNLAANAVTAGTIAAGAVGADQIAAHSISSDKLLVGDMTNQLDDPDFSLGDLRSWVNGEALLWSVNSTTAGLGSDGGKGVLVCAGATGGAARSATIYNSRTMGISNGDIWYATIQARCSVSDPKVTAMIFMNLLDANKNYMQTIGTPLTLTTTYQALSAQIQITNPAVKFINVGVQVQVAAGSVAGSQQYFDQAQMLRMSGVTLIQDGSILTQKIAASAVTGDKIVGNTITGDKIVGNTITGDKIAANTITANLIKAGSISADKLMVGSGQNLLVDPGFVNGGANALTYWIQGSNATVVPNSQGVMQASNENYLVVQPSDQSGTADMYSAAIPCNGNTSYMASAYLQRVGGTNAYLQLIFYDGNGTVISAPAITLPQGGNVGSVFSAYQRIAVPTALSPGNAITMRLALVHQGSGGTYIYHPQIEEALPNQTVPGTWGAGGATIIGPGSIKTGSLSAITANLGAITAGSLNINGRFIVAADGTTTIQTGTSGQRSVISGGTFLAYDGNNTLRYRAGVW